MEEITLTKKQLQEIVTNAHMAGQTHAGCTHSSFGDAIAWHVNNVVKNR